MLILLSVVLITLALVLYSIGVWLNWRSKRLLPTYIVLFWCGFAADALATKLMGARVERINWDLHTISGYAALALMGTLAAYGTASLMLRKESWQRNFHRFAVPIWIIWVISYATGVYLGIQRVSGS